MLRCPRGRLSKLFKWLREHNLIAGIDNKILLVSFLVHIILFGVVFFVGSNSSLPSHFLVYGAHSKRPTHAIFKPMKKVCHDAVQQKTDQKTVTEKKETKKARKKVVKKKQRKLRKKIVLKPKKADCPIIKDLDEEDQKKRPKKKRKKKKKKLEVKPPESKTEEPQPEEKESEVQTEQPVQENIEKQPTEQPKEEALHFNLMGSDDPNLALFQKTIQSAVEKVWQPPVGVPKGTECSVHFVLNKKGEVVQFEITRPSNVLIYDMSIARVAGKLEFGDCLWGKSFQIDFRQ